MTSTETSGWSPRATRTESASSPIASKPTRSGARQAALRGRVHDAAFRAPGHRGLDRRRVVAEDDHDLPHPGHGKGVEDVLEDRPAGERRQQLAAPEPRPGARREHEPHRRIGHTGIFPPALRRGTVRSRPCDRAPSGRDGACREGDATMSDDQGDVLDSATELARRRADRGFGAPGTRDA